MLIISSRFRLALMVCASFVIGSFLFSILISKSVDAGSLIPQQVCQHSVRPGAWTPTNLQLKAGQKVVISATGTFRYKDGARIEFGPGGDMYGIWSLKARIGNQIENVGGKGTVTATQDGQLELGAPAKANLPVEEGLTYLDSNYQYCVTVSMADEGQLSVSVEEGPKELWVGWGREPMAISFCIRGFISNSAEPLRVDCPKMDNSFGDHKDISGNRLKTVRMEHCGETAAPYNWAGHTCSGGPGYFPTPGYLWGMFISAPARDLENDQQPGRKKDICIGTNPVTLRFSQKGAGEAYVTVAPELVLKAGLVGGGGSGMKSNCDDNNGGGGGGAGGGTLRCGLGRVWRESESGWTGTWTRRGDSGVFDAHWERTGWRPIDQIATISVSGGRISIFRQDPNVAGNTCSYNGIVGSDGVSVTGEYTCNDRGNVIGPVPWNATIDCTATTRPTVDQRFVGAWVCPCKIGVELNADGTGAWVDNRGGPPGSMYASGRFDGTWTSSGDTATLTIPVAKHGNRGGVIYLRLDGAQLKDQFGDTYSR